jgi:hypothetical protein
MQVELLNREKWKTRIQLATAIHDYIELFHNTRHRHSALNMLTPTEYENHHQTTTTPPNSKTHTPQNQGKIPHSAKPGEDQGDLRCPLKTLGWGDFGQTWDGMRLAVRAATTLPGNVPSRR